MQPDNSRKNCIQLYFAKLLLNTVIHPFYYTVLLLIRILENFIFLQSDQIFQIFGIEAFSSSAYETFLFIILTLQIVFIAILVIGMILEIGQKISSQKQTIQSNIKILIRRFTCDILTIFRLTLIFPITSSCIYSLYQQYSSRSMSLSILNLIIMCLIVYPVSILIFFNKIVRKQNILSYAYIVNIDSIIFTYLPIMILLKVIASIIVPYFNFIVSIIMMFTIYYHPIITFKMESITRYTSTFIIATINLSSLYSIFNLRINTIGDLLFFILINLIFGYTLAQFMFNRIINLLKNTQQSKDNLQTIEGQDQSIFFHLIDFKNNKAHLLFYLLNLKRETKINEKKQLVQNYTMMAPTSPMNNRQPYSQLQQNSSNVFSQTKEYVAKSILNQLFQLLKQHEQDSSQFQELFYELIIRTLLQKYDPQHLSASNLGQHQIVTEIMHNPKTYLFISQILMAKKNSLRKSYFLIKTHQKILKQIKKYSFISGIEIYSLLMIISSSLEQQRQKKQNNLKAQNYFDFQIKYQLLKQLIQKSAEICYEFWNQIKQKQPNIQKANKLVQLNFSYSNKIQQTYNNIFVNFERKSPLILFDLITRYSSIILNNKIPSLLNPYNNLITKTKDEVEIQKLQGLQKITNRNQINFCLLQEIAVCIIDIQGNFGKIQWGNQIFWNQIYFNKQTYQSHQKIEQYKKQNCSILDIMLKEFVPEHQYKYFKEFAQGQHFNYKHEYALTFSSAENIVERALIEMQILPSIKNGLKLSIFFKKKVYENSHFLDLILNQDIQFVAWSNNLMRQSRHMFQEKSITDQRILQDHQEFVSNLLKNQIFNQFLKDSNNIQAVRNSHQTIYQLRGCLQLEKNDYNFSLKSKNKYITLNELKDTKNFKRDIQRSEKYLIHIQFSNTALEFSQKVNIIDEHTLAVNSLQPITSKYHQLNQNFINSFQSNIFNLKVDNPKSQVRVPVKFRQRKQTMVPFQVGQQVQQRAQQTMKSDKTYTVLITTKTPVKISLWQHVVTVLVCLLILLTVLNILIPYYRKQIYLTDYTTIKYYNEVIAETARILISLRGLNFYAAMRGPDDPHLPFYATQLNLQAIDITSKITTISSVMTDIWQAYQFLDSGQVKVVNQNSYVVYSNYMLSPINYISKLAYQKMAFPIINSMYDLFAGYTTAQKNYQSAMFNGVWTIMVNIKNGRVQIMDNISNEILPIYKQLFIFPTIGGLLILLVFMISSIYIERKSQLLKKSVFKLLQIMPYSLCRKKKEDIQLFIDRQLQFRQNEKTIEAKQNLFKLLSKTFFNFSNNMPPTKSKQNSIFQQKKSQFCKENLGQNTSSADTLRQFKNQSQPEGLKNYSTDETMQTSSMYQPSKMLARKRKESGANRKKPQIIGQNAAPIYIKTTSKLKILFYLIICLPFIVYFVFMFAEGTVFNKKMMTYLTIQSDLYARQSNLQYVYSWTRQTTIYQENILGKANWTKHVIGQIQNTYDSERQFNILLQQMDPQSRLRKYLASIQTGNICSDKLSQFNPSIYYGIFFTYSQCMGLSQSIMTQGLRPIIVYYLETAILMLQRYTDPGHMSLQTRVSFITSADFKLIKTILAYLDQLFGLAYKQFQIDFQTLINNHIQLTIIYSIISVLTFLIIFVAIYYRWKSLMRQKKQIKSFIQLISYQTLKNNQTMLKEFLKIQTDLYQ